MSRAQAAIERLLSIMERLRGPQGCPWDREQTLESMTPYLIEEAVETGEAVASGDPRHTAEELGDLAFLAVFCLDLLAERGGPGLAEAFEMGAAKLIRRHPHVYGDAVVGDGDAAYRQWQEIKQAEQGTRSLLGDQPEGLPALVGAFRVQEKAGAVGFDWPDVSGPLAKVREELGEIEAEMKDGSQSRVAGEIGDLLFAVVNLARHLRIDPERELRGASHRFRDRFHHVERRLAERGSSPSQSTLAEMDELWNEAKAIDANRSTP
jgi:MazG family protein